MPRLLFVSHHFPPDTSIGSKRSRRIATWMTRLGWTVDVLASWPIYQDGRDDALVEDLEGVGVVRTHEFNPRAWAKALRARIAPQPALAQTMPSATQAPMSPPRGSLLSRLANDWLEVPDPWMGWLPNALIAAEQLQRPDLVLATIPTFSNAIVATMLSRRFDVPLVLDFRDPWNPVQRRRHLPSARVQVERRLEAACLGRATRILATTHGAAAEIGDLARKHVDVVFNACEPERFAEVTPRAFGRRTLLYTGNLYGSRTLDPILDAMVRLRARDPERARGLALCYIGSNAAPVAQSAAARGLDEHVVAEGVCPHRDALAAMLGADANLCIVGDEHARQIPAKLFEQIASGRPLVTIGPRGCDAEALLHEIGIGRFVASDDPSHIDRTLDALLADPTPARGAPAASPPRLSAAGTMGVLDAVLRDAIAGRTLPARPERPVRIAAMGDVMIPERVAELLATRPMELFGEAGERLNAADVGFVNLETPLVVDAPPCPSDNPLQPVFVAPASLARGLRACGVRVANLGNNHIADAGALGIAQTRAACEAAGIVPFGAGRDLDEARRPAIVEVEGVRVGFLGYSAFCSAMSNSAGCAPLDLAGIEADVRALRDRAHHVVVSVHTGIEYAALPAGSHRDLYRAIADAGADVVLGHHPHVWQGHEWRRGALIVFSLGNALSDTSDRAIKRLAFARTDLVLAGLMEADLDDPRTEDAVVASFDLTPRGPDAAEVLLYRIGADFCIHPSTPQDRARFEAADRSANDALAGGTDPRFAHYDVRWANGAVSTLNWRVFAERWRRIRPRHVRTALKVLGARLRGDL